MFAWSCCTEEAEWSDPRNYDPILDSQVVFPEGEAAANGAEKMWAQYDLESRQKAEALLDAITFYLVDNDAIARLTPFLFVN